MRFSELANYFQKLETTSSRLGMTEILASLFRHATHAEVGPICYLLQGRVAPLYEATEFRIADKLLIRAITKACEIDERIVIRAFKKHGDFGIAAEEIVKKQAKSVSVINSGKEKRKTVKEVFQLLKEIALTEGEGSQEKKIQILADLISSLDPLSVRYVVRIPLDKLRLGFSDMTILDAFSWMLTGDKSLHLKLENAYNVRPDMAYVGKQLKEYGMKGLQHVHAVVGAPILASLCARLPNAVEMIEKMGEVDVEPKYDGVRCIGGYTGIFIKGKGYISAKYVKQGDEVLSHKGEFRKVLAVHRRLPGKGECFYKIQTMIGDECIISGDHPILVKGQESTRWLEAKSLHVNHWVIFPYVKKAQEKYPNSLLFEDSSGYKKTIKTNADFFRFLGFWVGDGFSNNSHQSERIGLTFNAKTEQQLAKEYEMIIHEIIGIRDISRNVRNGGLNLYWRDSVFRRWITREFRYKLKNGSHGKTIPWWMLRISKEQFLAFLRGWNEADGTQRHSGGSRIITKEQQLASMTVILSSAFHYPVGVRKIRAGARAGDQYHTYYELIIPGTDKYIKREKDYFLVKIHTIRQYKLDSRVHLYDFQIEHDESYCTSLMSLHNCQIHYKKDEKKDWVQSFSRNLENTTAMYPELMHIGKQIDTDEVILDSEAIGYDVKTDRLIPFQETMTRKRKHEVEYVSNAVPLRFFVFDILYKDGKDLMREPLSKRRKILEDTIIKGDILAIAPNIVTSDVHALRKYHDEQLKNGLEGVVVKKWQSAYEPGRKGFHWVKFKEEGKTGKLSDTIDAVVMGYYHGEGKRAGFGIGAFLVGVKNGEQYVTATKIGTGVSDELWVTLRKQFSDLRQKEKPKQYHDVDKTLLPDVWIAPKLIVEIAADDITKSPIHGAGFALRFPRLVRVRADKSPQQATTVSELGMMYANQESLQGS